jgi:hypothetical protein
MSEFVVEAGDSNSKHTKSFKTKRDAKEYLRLLQQITQYEYYQIVTKLKPSPQR